MPYKSFVRLSIAVIGTGKLSESITKALALAGHDMYIGSRSEATVLSPDVAELKNITLCSVEDAAAEADAIIITATSEEVREVAYYMEDVRRKVIIDFSGMNFTRFGQYINTITAIKAITGSPFVVKCYNCNGFESLLGNASSKPADMYMAGDSVKAKEVAKVLVRELGFDNCFDYGGDNCVEELDNMSLQWLTTSVDPQHIPQFIKK